MRNVRYRSALDARESWVHASVAVTVMEEPPILKAALAEKPLALQEGRCSVKLFIMVTVWDDKTETEGTA
jgi:hypothetical protein